MPYVDTRPYNTNDDYRYHAWVWAFKYYGLDLADAFVAYLCSLDEDEQLYIFNNGYPCAIQGFDALG